ncbi:MAG TPA: LysR family transcriptional regulator [Thermoleophilaceae bacterium]|nr:LysR family transcriptional regulator [Thermoleophilaceae bacterium]
MELRHLRYFVSIAEEGSFTRAAERLWVAQPGLSTQIRRLEAELRVKLFERHARGVHLTDAGELFLERARSAIAAADEAFSTGRDLEAGLVGTLSLGIATEAGWGALSELLDEFRPDRRKIELTVVESHGGTLLRDLRDGRLHAVVAPSMFDSTGLFRSHLGRERWLVLAGGTHRLAGATGALSADELEGERILISGHRDGAAYDRAVAETLTELEVKPELCSGRPGPALFSGVASGEALALTTCASTGAGGLVARPLEPQRSVDFALIWRDETPAPALRRFIEVAATIAAPAPAGRRVAA